MIMQTLQARLTQLQSEMNNLTQQIRATARNSDMSPPHGLLKEEILDVETCAIATRHRAAQVVAV